MVYYVLVYNMVCILSMVYYVLGKPVYAVWTIVCCGDKKKSDVGIHPNIARGTTDPEIDFVTWIKLDNNMAPLASVANLATKWQNLHWFKIWSSGSTTGSKVDQQVAPLHCHIALNCPIDIIR